MHPGSHADAIAARFSRAISSRWAADSPQDEAIDAFWTAPAPPEPDDPPLAVTMLGSLPVIRWRRMGDDFAGYTLGRRDGCYLVPDPGRPPGAA